MITEEEPSYYFWATSQRRLGIMLQEYIAWVDEYYENRSRVLILKSDPSRRSARAATPTKPRGTKTRAKSKLQVAKESGAWEFVEPCAPSCREEDCSLQGSSVKYEIKTCVKCGTVGKTERAPETPCYS